MKERPVLKDFEYVVTVRGIIKAPNENVVSSLVSGAVNVSLGLLAGQPNIHIDVHPKPLIEAPIYPHPQLSKIQ